MGGKSRSLIPIIDKGSFEADVIAATTSLLQNGRVEKFDMTVDKDARIARIKAVADDGRTSTTDILGPGLSATVNYNPSDKTARDTNIATLFHRGFTQSDSARMLNISQPLVSKVQRRLGLR